MLPKYYHHVGKYENTLITKFFGLHRITLRGGKKVLFIVCLYSFFHHIFRSKMHKYIVVIFYQVRFVIMGNMFCTGLHIHRRYDLKGSSQGRVTKKDKINGNTTLKDLDLKYEFHMDKKWRESLMK